MRKFTMPKGTTLHCYAVPYYAVILCAIVGSAYYTSLYFQRAEQRRVLTVLHSTLIHCYVMPYYAVLLCGTLCSAYYITLLFQCGVLALR